MNNYKALYFLERSCCAYGLGSVLLFVQSFWKVCSGEKLLFPKRDFTAHQGYLTWDSSVMEDVKRMME